MSIKHPQTEPDELGWHRWSVRFMGDLCAEGGCRTAHEARAASRDLAELIRQCINAERTITWEIER